ncbi:histidine phosphatase family protein [Clostridium aminobutyricum]|uniref:Histidine phosphatase family protein n=1 Tax=Clostridium aminobutyricum TaxID=33953 RepID=A0A939DBR2_CLOAM|nr:histidine phosphatase family protein [Clostridium aminobutyricum]MBN7774368.1 histidine phosphatase family protein [Clostridium aminobutyricum]
MGSYIHLIRHGTTEGNIKRLYYGNSDIPLLEEGRQLISSLLESGIYPVAEDADFYTSGLKRTEETFHIIFGETEHTVIEELQEMHFGDFEMHSYEELKENKFYLEWIEDKSGENIPPNGESRVMFAERVVKGFQKVIDFHRLKELSVRHSGKDIHSIVVCHGGVISAIMSTYFPNEKNHFFAWLPELGHGYTLELKEGTPTGYIAF